MINEAVDKMVVIFLFFRLFFLIEIYYIYSM